MTLEEIRAAKQSDKFNNVMNFVGSQIPGDESVKPHIKKISLPDGYPMWYCCALMRSGVTGQGRTPKSAYEHWRRQFHLGQHWRLAFPFSDRYVLQDKPHHFREERFT